MGFFTGFILGRLSKSDAPAINNVHHLVEDGLKFTWAKLDNDTTEIEMKGLFRKDKNGVKHIIAVFYDSDSVQKFWNNINKRYMYSSEEIFMDNVKVVLKKKHTISNKTLHKITSVDILNQFNKNKSNITNS